VLGSDHHRFTNGAIGNALSHRALWRRASASGRPVIICEDDCCLRADFVEAAGNAIAKLPEGWDVAFLGYNTDAAVAVQTPEGLKTVLVFDEKAKRQEGYFDSYAREGKGLGPSTLLRCFQRWGTLCYIVSPSGAAKLERHCFPLSTNVKVVMFAQNRAIDPNGLDGMVNLALQRTDIEAYCLFPPLALSDNAAQDSDVLPRTSQLSGVGVAER
jgi:glycosyl transferase, family 25